MMKTREVLSIAISWKVKMKLLLMFLLSSSFLFAGVDSQKQTYVSEEEEISEETAKNSNCKIIINIERITGIKESQTIYTSVKSKEECEKKSKPHRHNFYPKEVKSKSVEALYQGEKN